MFAGPAEVTGRLEKIRNIMHPVLILLFLFLPWLKLNGVPFLLLDFWNRHFVIFGVSFYSHEAPLLFFFLILILLAIFIVTAIFGRLWCGWTCPQTVFLHSVFNKIEKWLLGPFARRVAFYNSEDNLKKKTQVILLYVIYLAVCWAMSHSFVAYFVGSQQIVDYISNGPSQHPVAFVVLSIMTVVFFANFVFFRERLCMYVCPYGRFQNALIDNNSMVVFYDSRRGEPRSKRQTTPDRGDCVDCRRCVNVCPVKIDIREGFQLDCIACGKCVDACNDVMQKVNRPSHLIRYETGNQKKITLKRFRLLLYGILFLVFSIAFLWSLINRASLDVTISRSHQNAINVRTVNNKIVFQNQLQLHIKNQSNRIVVMNLALSEQDQLKGYSLFSPAMQMILQPHQDSKLPAFLEVAKDNLQTNYSDEIELLVKTENEVLIKKIKFMRLR